MGSQQSRQQPVPLLKSQRRRQPQRRFKSRYSVITDQYHKVDQAEQEDAFKQDMLTIGQYDDILENSLPNREHSRKVRGVGSHVSIKKTYDRCRKRKRDTSSESKVEIEQIIQREVKKRLKPFREQQEALQKQMEILMGQQIDTGNTLVGSLGAVQSSCQSLQPQHCLNLIEESCNGLQVSTPGKSVQSDAFTPKQYKKFDGLNFDKLGTVFKNLRDRFLKKVDNEFPIDLPFDLFHSKDLISVHADDLKDLMTPKTWLTAPIIQIFMLYAHKYYKDKYPNELVGFMDPEKICYNFLLDDLQRDFVDAYIKSALKENRDKRIIFIPYHQIDHWVLVVLMAKESTLYVFDSDQKTQRKLEIIEALRECYEGQGKNANLKIINCKCPQQPGCWECGYYVMLFVHDIITRFLDIFPNLKEFPKSYNETNIDYIRSLWSKFLLKEVLVEKK